MASTTPVRVYHNPRCGTSRAVLELLAKKGIEPEVVEYLAAGWTEPVLRRLMAKSATSARGLLRQKEPLAQELRLAGADEAALIAAMIDHPILVNRPIVESGERAVLARPAERVWEIVRV
ncbi:MAG TPA: arsenate reductase (glutaredoxin) [Caulobacteraceae bacterium]|jgi:arsenate reductase|nr:arsenate reductase (glutaredoxin) [Caulobacteraceae bacterium]